MAIPKSKIWVKIFPGLVTGICLTLSFPKGHMWLLAFAALIPMLSVIRGEAPRTAFLIGFSAGLIHFLSLIYWIIPTVHVYGGLHILLAGATLVLLCVYLALYPAIFAWLLNITDLRRDAWYAPFAASGLWSGIDYIRTYAFTGFSWGALGYSQYLNLTMIQIADLSGVYGISFLIVFINYALAECWAAVRSKRKLPLKIVGLSVFLLTGVLVYGYVKMDMVDKRIAAAPKTAVSVIQGNIRQDQKWDKAFKNSIVDKYISLSGSQLKHAPDLVIWPETALPFYYRFDRPMSEKVNAFVRQTGTTFLIGSPAFVSEDKEIRYYNRAYMINRFSIITGTYDKNQLVPFGEYVPLGNFFTFLGKITAQSGNFSTGDGKFIPLKFKENSTGVLICFESLFPGISADFVKNGADILTTITNDAWFGYTSAPPQHFAIAVLRAVETRRSLARAANTGISGFVYPSGRIFETTDLFSDAAITHVLPVMKEITFYTAFGDLFAITVMVAICLVFMVKVATKKFVKKS